MVFDTSRVRPLGVCLVLMGVAGCGGSGGGDPTADPFFFGAADDSGSGNGLPFAEEGVLFPLNTTIEVPVITTDMAMTRVAANPRTSTTSFQSGLAFSLGGAATFDIDLEGETVAVTDGLGLMADGTVIEAARLTSRGGATLVGFRTTDEAEFGALSMFGFGAETPPSVVADSVGSATLNGALNFIVAAYQDDALTSATADLSGNATMTVDFDAGTVTGSAFSDALLDGDGRLLADFAEADIVGNSAAGTVTWSCDSGATCADTGADYGLVFIGNDAMTAFGLTSIETDLTVGDQDFAVVGVSGFIVDDEVIAE